MKTCNAKLSVGVLAIAVQSALAVMFSMPLLAQAQTAATTEADEVAALVHPANFIEVGAGNVSESSAKFGEYNGLSRSGGYAVGNFSYRGGSAYDGGEGVYRWGVSGVDVGTKSHELGATAASQGQWNIGFRFDELTHAITDTYQSPFIGVMGGNVFTLPGNFGIINTTAITNNNSQLVGTRNLNAAQLGDFNTYNVGTTRKTSAFSAGYIINRQWNLQFDYSHLNQSGAKLISGGSSSVTTGIGAAGIWAAEDMITLMNPTDYQTDTFNLALNWTGETGFFSGSLYSSLFNDGTAGLYWQNPMGKGSATTGATTTTLAGGYQPDMLSTAPNNIFNQINAKGGYSFTPTTKVAGGVSYGHNTQAAGYTSDLMMMQPGGLPETALNGLVITKNVNAKVTDSSVKHLTLNAGFKYNERENLSDSHVYLMYDLGALQRLEINTPYSNSKTEYELAAAYRITSAQNLSLAYTNEGIERWCQNVAGAVSPTLNGGVSPANAQCVIVPSSKEDKLALAYRYKVSGDLNLNASYSHASRKSTVDQNALTPLNDGKGNNMTGFINSGNFPGFVSFFDASRDQDLAKLGANWQPMDVLSLSLSGKYTKDQYKDEPLGAQKGHSSSVNFDTSLNFSENGTISFYATEQDRYRYTLSGASAGSVPNAVGQNSDNNTAAFPALIAPSNVFSNSLHDKDTTVGLNLQQKGLLDGKLDMTADVSLALGNTYYTTGVPYYYLSPASTAVNSATCASSAVLSCGSTPTITNRTLQFKLTGQYQVNKHSKIAVRYMYQKENTNDYYYNVYQYGFSSSTMLPTNQQSPNYSVNAVAATYIYSF